MGHLKYNAALRPHNNSVCQKAESLIEKKNGLVPSADWEMQYEEELFIYSCCCGHRAVAWEISSEEEPSCHSPLDWLMYSAMFILLDESFDEEAAAGLVTCSSESSFSKFFGRAAAA